MSGREWVCRGCICFNKCLWYPAKAGQSMARSWPSLSACALGEGSSGAGSAGGGAGAAAGFRCRRVRRRFAPRGASWGLPALQTSPGRELFLGRADADLQSGPPLGWLRYYCRARSEEKQGQASWCHYPGSSCSEFYHQSLIESVGVFVFPGIICSQS